jgi:hypothetical protein
MVVALDPWLSGPRSLGVWLYQSKLPNFSIPISLLRKKCSKYIAKDLEYFAKFCRTSEKSLSSAYSRLFEKKTPGNLV